MAIKRHRLLKRQQLLAIKRRKKLLTAGSQHVSKPSNVPSFSNKRFIPNLLPRVKNLDNITVNQALDRLCQQLHRHSLNQTYYNDCVEKLPPVL